MLGCVWLLRWIASKCFVLFRCSDHATFGGRQQSTSACGVYFPVMHQLLLLLLLLLPLGTAADNRRRCRTLLGSNRLMLCDASGNVLRVKHIQIKRFSIDRPAMFELLSCLSEGRALSASGPVFCLLASVVSHLSRRRFIVSAETIRTTTQFAHAEMQMHGTFFVFAPFAKQSLQATSNHRTSNDRTQRNATTFAKTQSHSQVVTPSTKRKNDAIGSVPGFLSH